MNPYEPESLWEFLPWGYLLTIALETPVLWFGLSAGHSPARRLFAGVWLTACTYPIVVLVMPLVIVPAWGYLAYLGIAETFAPAAECLLFWLTFRPSPPDAAENNPPSATPQLRDYLAIITANLVSFLIGGAILSSGFSAG